MKQTPTRTPSKPPTLRTYGIVGALDALIALAFWTVGGLRDPWIPLFVVAGFVVFVVFSELGRARNRSVRP